MLDHAFIMGGVWRVAQTRTMHQGWTGDRLWVNYRNWHVRSTSWRRPAPRACTISF